MPARQNGSRWFERLAERRLRSPALYDLVQNLAGERQVQRRLAPHLSALPVDCRVVDIGGGTGLSRQAVPAGRYVCLDLDVEKLRRFRSGGPDRLAVLADAAWCPLRTGTVDVALCAKVLHHLDDDTLEAMLAETARILRPGGVLILIDAVRTTRWASQVLWRFDRGSYPRRAVEIRRALPRPYAILVWEEFDLAARHAFVLCVARRD